MEKFCAVFAGLSLIAPLVAIAEPPAPLKLATKYPISASIKGRFDHLGIDLQGNRLFLAAESAHEVPVLDLQTGKYLHTIPDIEIPHAIFVRHDLNRIYITDGGAGALKIYDGTTHQLIKAIRLKVDSDSIVYDPKTHYLYIVNGGGDAHESFSMISIVDTTSDEKVGEIKIDGDTLEAMALESSGPRMYVNNPAKNAVTVIDRNTRSQVANWPVTLGQHNVAMALDNENHRLFVACRSGNIVVFDTRTGKELQSLPIERGVDDLVFDPISKRIYAPCGANGGFLFVYKQQDPDHYTLLGKVQTGLGGKNGVLVPQRNQYFLFVPPQAAQPGAVYVYSVE
jgi:DNA-binding beta-propeller fold protein YncE